MAYEPHETLPRRLTDPVAWLTTVTSTGRPAPRPIWFVGDGDTLLVFSQPTAVKVKHIEANPLVSVNFNTGAGGGDVLVLSGRAKLVPDIKPSTTPGYLEKYESHYPGIEHDVESFDAMYSQGIRITPDRTWGF
ncbi:MAG: pyridoxamine 5-phosphate oxidase [Amycolatopsis sp.]|jgi:PPOX class probable F420-dependent enzyme|uniref:pyridoxamine 5'-phosphate oxidase family protein n=1 Tax=Amycolatopsis sp. TaxID=37632 RepID=UPI0026335904|nr:pyridoxamine 5'-phosphate oxidase family protein [Amycolatopsis sp.]MCU1682609.1 pyridoxamine 5-phosphate oxidase [Amycolatopsis sp.]